MSSSLRSSILTLDQQINKDYEPSFQRLEDEFKQTKDQDAYERKKAILNFEKGYDKHYQDTYGRIPLYDYYTNNRNRSEAGNARDEYVRKEMEKLYRNSRSDLLTTEQIRIRASTDETWDPILAAREAREAVSDYGVKREPAKWPTGKTQDQSQTDLIAKVGTKPYQAKTISPDLTPFQTMRKLILGY